MNNITVISNREEFDEFLILLKNKVSLVYPFFSDVHLHPAVNRPSVAVFFVGNKIFLMSFHHNEAPPVPTEWLSQIDFSFSVVPSKKDWFHFIKLPVSETAQSRVKLVDSTTEEFLRFHRLEEWNIPLINTEIRNRYRSHSNVNDAVPMVKLIEEAECWRNHVLRFFSKSAGGESLYYHNTLPSVLYELERNGIKVDETELVEHFGEKSRELILDGKVYTQYHQYHITGRPSNAFGGINFAALNKKDGTRNSFVSRFERGKLILIDYESFHLRLIAHTIGWDQPDIPFHTYLGQQYFNVDVLTPEQYEEGKAITFRHLYSEERGTTNIPFFLAVYKWIDEFWSTAEFNGYFSTYNSLRTISLDDIDYPTKSKIFNYYVQSMESDIVLSSISRLLPMYSGKQSKIILYTYDGILIDFCLEDGKELLRGTRIALEKCPLKGNYTSFPTRVYVGDNFGELVRLGE